MRIQVRASSQTKGLDRGRKREERLPRACASLSYPKLTNLRIKSTVLQSIVALNFTFLFISEKLYYYYYYFLKKEKKRKTFFFIYCREWQPRDRSVQSVLNITMTKTNVLGC